MTLPARSLEPLLQYEPDNYSPPDYNPTRQIEGMHDWPRWGATTKFTSVFEGQDQRSEYIRGIAIGSLITLFVFIGWALVLLLLKCAGKRVGCASGVPRKPKEPAISGISEEEYQQNVTKWTSAVKKYERQLLISRTIFLISGFGVIISSILFYVKGVGSLVNSLGDVQRSVGETKGILRDLHNLTGNFIEVGETAAAERDAFVNEVQTDCGTVVDAALDAAVSGEAKQEIEQVIQDILDVDDFLHDIAVDLQSDLAEAITLAQDVNNGLDKAYPFLYCTGAAMFILIIIVICLMVEVILAWLGRKMRNCFVACMKNAVILPIFFLFILLSWLFASLFQLAAIGGSDFCVVPDQNIEEILKKYVEDDMSPILFAYFTYYLRCESDLQPVSIIGGSEPFWKGINAIHDFIEYIADNGASVADVCGGENLPLIQELAFVLHSTMHVVNGLLIVALNLLKCSTFNPIYRGVLHSGLCINGASGLAWLFSTLLCMGIFSMIMITFRAARAEKEGDAEYVEDIDGGYEPYDPKKSVDDRERPGDNEEAHDLSLQPEEHPHIEPDPDI